MGQIETTNLFDNYELGDTILSELNNNLTLVNAIIEKKKLKGLPDFYILGGAAMMFHSLNYNSTLDIDTANRIEDSIRDDVSLFIDDAASEVAKLPFNYKSRAKRIREDLECIEVYILSKEDLLINKLLSGRRKDIKAIMETGLLETADIEVVGKIISTELERKDRTFAELVLDKLIYGKIQ